MSTKLWIGTDSGNEGDWSVAANWSPSGVPTNSDDVYLENTSQSVTSGFSQSAVTLASLNIGQSFTGEIGTATGELAISATLLRIGYHNGQGTPSGSNRIKLNLGSVQSEIIITNTSVSSTDTYLEPVRIKGTHASNTIQVLGGTVGVATTDASEAATISEASVLGNNARLHLPAGVTLTTLNVAAGTCSVGCAATTIEQTGGSLTTYGEGAITTVNVDSGRAALNSDGTITTLRVGSAGSVDMSGDARAKTVTNCEVYGGGGLDINNGNPQSITLTNGIDLVRTTVSDALITHWPNVTVSLSAI